MTQAVPLEGEPVYVSAPGMTQGMAPDPNTAGYYPPPPTGYGAPPTYSADPYASDAYKPTGYAPPTTNYPPPPSGTSYAPPASNYTSPGYAAPSTDPYATPAAGVGSAYDAYDASKPKY
jgi:hypothetical protein